ncbi:MAG: CDP-alcohol phosphatidyltransferase family protein [Ignavibacteriales bacterium]|nr:CDP-alcohol phosphatidyltransferase family protein [Ignavibacteriales bacterium]
MVQHKPWRAFIVFLAAGATDALDGFAARAAQAQVDPGAVARPHRRQAPPHGGVRRPDPAGDRRAERPAPLADGPLHRPRRGHRPGRPDHRHAPGQTDLPAHARRQGQHDLPGLPDVLRALSQRRGQVARVPGAGSTS